MNTFRTLPISLTLLLLAGTVTTICSVPNGNTDPNNAESSTYRSSSSCPTSSCSTINNSSCSSCGSYDASCGCSNSNNSCGSCSTFLVGRDASSNTAYRRFPKAFLGEYECEFNMDVDLGFEYQRTFNSAKLAQAEFGGCNLSFKGSQVAGRSSATDLLADNFGLSPLFSGTLNLNPVIQSFNLKFQSFWGFDNWVEGLYARLDFTFAHQDRNLFGGNGCSPCLTTTAVGSTAPFQPGQMGPAAVTPAADILTALGGNFTFGDTSSGLPFGRFSKCKLSDNKIAGFSIDVGYTFWESECSHLGAFIRYEAPTGTNLKLGNNFVTYAFAPVIGNMHHHGLGGGINAHAEVWADDCGNSIRLHLDGYATHLFKNCGVRSFDLNLTGTNVTSLTSSSTATSAYSNGCMSRYLLLKQYRPVISTDANQALGYIYTGTNIQAIAFSTRNVQSSISVTGDATLSMIYERLGADSRLQVEAGYNIFGRSRETLCLNTTSSAVCNAYDPSFRYGIKGCTGDYYFTYATTGANPSQTSSTPGQQQLNNASSSNSTITSCGAIDGSTTTSTASLTTPGLVGVDYTNAYRTTGATAANAVPVNTEVLPAAALNVAFVSQPAVVLDPVTSLNLQSGSAARLVSHKGFVSFNYLWEGCNWDSYVGFGGEVEGGSRNTDFNQWGLWVKTGLAF